MALLAQLTMRFLKCAQEYERAGRMVSAIAEKIRQNLSLKNKSSGMHKAGLEQTIGTLYKIEAKWEKRKAQAQQEARKLLSEIGKHV